MKTASKIYHDKVSITPTGNRVLLTVRRKPIYVRTDDIPLNIYGAALCLGLEQMLKAGIITEKDIGVKS